MQAAIQWCRSTIGAMWVPTHGPQRALKRHTDLIVATALLILAAPLIAVAAVLIRLTSPGPVIYRQTRVGLDGSEFEMLKLRSMVDDAERLTGPVWAARNDPRITAVGKCLRKYRIDELPQLVNVLNGEMSLVGPRPERPAFVNPAAFRIRRADGNQAGSLCVLSPLFYRAVGGDRGVQSIFHPCVQVFQVIIFFPAEFGINAGESEALHQG